MGTRQSYSLESLIEALLMIPTTYTSVSKEIRKKKNISEHSILEPWQRIPFFRWTANALIRLSTDPSLRWARHYENTPIQIYWEIYHQKNKNFQMNNSGSFHISAQNIDCGYSLEPPHRGGSNEYPHLCFWAEIRKIRYTPINTSFTI